MANTWTDTTTSYTTSWTDDSTSDTTTRNASRFVRMWPTPDFSLTTGAVNFIAIFQDDDDPEGVSFYWDANNPIAFVAAGYTEI